MPILIDEFEILPAPPPVAEPVEPSSPSAPPLAPEDIERVDERFRLRIARVWAD